MTDSLRRPVREMESGLLAMQDATDVNVAPGSVVAVRLELHVVRA